MATARKMIEYRIASWFLEEEYDLEELIRDAWEILETAAGRSVLRSDMSTVRGLKGRDFGRGGFAIHCVKYVDRQGIGVVPMEDTDDVEISEQEPDPEENYLNNDFMALIKGNHLITMNAGINAATLRSYLSGLFRNADMDTNTEKFELVRVTKAEEAERIDRIGVSKVDLRLSINDALALALEDSQDDSISSKFFGGLGKIFLENDELEDVQVAEKGHLNLSINIPKGDLQTARNGINELAKVISDDQEEGAYIIHLRDQTVIKANEMMLKKPVKVQKVANSVSVYEMWDKMRSFMNELEEGGYLGA